MVMFQNKYYGAMAVFMGFIFPTLVAGIGWGDWKGGYYFAAVTRLVFVHHATFFVNSLAHTLGDQPFADTQTPRDSFVTAFMTLGEGYHNFHHEFPQDYRNAIKFYQYDPTKWLINVLSIFGLTFDLRTFGENEIKMGVWQMKKKKVIDEKEKFTQNNKLEELTWDDIEKSNKKLIVIDNYVLDISDFIEEHPGGDIITRYIGKDATPDLMIWHNHSNGAKRLQESKRIGILKKVES
jgi:stearoyl-CoA desaturase (delta-9 desaturase)